MTGQIRLGMTEDTSGGGLARILGRFTRRHPDVAVQTPVSQSLAIAAQLEHGELDIGILQLFAHRARPSDRILARDSLHWVKSPDLRLDLSRQVPFLPFDDNCFYRHWTMEVGQSQPPGLASVLTCPSGAGILCALHAGLGVRLLSTRQITPEMEGLSEPLPPPPEVAQIVRIGSGAGASAVRALVDEIATELGQPTTAQAA
nr:substrate-binding domain-containing protein [Thiorhodococcus minor]